MKTSKTLADCTAQLGRIALLELELTKRNNPRTWRKMTQPRTNAAKRILGQYIVNILGFLPTAEELDTSKELRNRFDNEQHTANELKGI